MGGTPRAWSTLPGPDVPRLTAEAGRGRGRGVRGSQGRGTTRRPLPGSTTTGPSGPQPVVALPAPAWKPPPLTSNRALIPQTKYPVTRSTENRKISGRHQSKSGSDLPPPRREPSLRLALLRRPPRGRVRDLEARLPPEKKARPTLSRDHPRTTWKVGLQHTVLNIQNPDTKEHMTVNALIDTGANHTAISGRLADKLGLQGMTAPYRVVTFGGENLRPSFASGADHPPNIGRRASTHRHCPQRSKPLRELASTAVELPQASVAPHAGPGVLRPRGETAGWTSFWASRTPISSVR